jgi:hypothetical protein
MKISTVLDDAGFLPDLYGKYAPESAKIDEHPCVSMPVFIEDAPTETVTFALEFVDFDAIPVGGFCWIHWVACNIDGRVRELPENASALEAAGMVQGSNSDWSPLAGGHRDPRVIHRYAGPYPPNKPHVYTLNVYALDCRLDLQEGFYLNELRRAMQGHVLATAQLEVTSRS